jgi:hypothetical protein
MDNGFWVLCVFAYVENRIFGVLGLINSGKCKVW